MVINSNRYIIITVTADIYQVLTKCQALHSEPHSEAQKCLFIPKELLSPTVTSDIHLHPLPKALVSAPKQPDRMASTQPCWSTSMIPTRYHQVPSSYISVFACQPCTAVQVVALGGFQPPQTTCTLATASAVVRVPLV